MRGSFLLRREDAGAFERNIDVEILPWQGRRILGGGDLDLAVADADRIAGDLHLAGKAAVHGIEPQEMRIGLNRSEVVDGDHLDIVALRLGDRAQNVAADAAEPVDGDTD